MDHIVADKVYIELTISIDGRKTWLMFVDKFGDSRSNQIVIVYDKDTDLFTLVSAGGVDNTSNQKFKDIRELFMTLNLDEQLLQRMFNLFVKGVSEWEQIYGERSRTRKETTASMKRKMDRRRSNRERRNMSDFKPSNPRGTQSRNRRKSEKMAKMNKARRKFNKSKNSYPTGGTGSKYNPSAGYKTTKRRFTKPVTPSNKKVTKVMAQAEELSKVKFNPQSISEADKLYGVALTILGAVGSNINIKKLYFKKIRKYHPDKCKNSYKTIDDIKACEKLGLVVNNAMAYIKEYKDGVYGSGFGKKKRKSKKRKSMKKRKSKKKMGDKFVVASTFRRHSSIRRKKKRR